MKLKRILILCLLLLLLAGCGDSGHETSAPTDPPPQAPVLRESVTVEAGVGALDPAAFLTDSDDPVPGIVENLSAEQLSAPGIYSVKLECGGAAYTASVVVVDTTAPEGTVQELTSTEAIPEASAFLVEILDVSEVTVQYKREPVLVYGIQTVTLILTDASGNTTELVSLLTLDLDIEAPQIHGVQDILVDQGSAVSYRSGITMTDNRDETPTLSVDSSQVDLSTPGTYTVTYTATDDAGNSAQATATVTVREMGENYASLETIYEMVDKIIEDIIDEDMTVEEQLKAIDKWFWRNCTYTGWADDKDLHQAAYVMMTKFRGDCYNYHGLTKLLLDRLGIPNIDVHKVKNYDGDSNHFWSMVSLDGGETWYHLDTSPRNDPDTGAGVHIFLYTDAELDAFSARYRNCYNRDKSLYPATPEE